VLLHATDRLFHTTEKIFQIVECRGCRLIRLHPRPTPREITAYYPETYYYAPGDDKTSKLEEMYRRVVLLDHVWFAERAIRDCGEEGVILDVGCGGGLFLDMMRRRGHRVAGLDFSIAAAATAWRQHGVPVICGSLSTAPLLPGSCAAITMYHVLEHLYDPVAYLEAAHSLLAADGRLIVQVPNVSSWQFLIFGETWNGVDVPRHLIDFRASDLDQLLDHCGFEVLRHKHFSLRDNPAGLASSIAPSLDPMARRVRKLRESQFEKLCKDFIYLALATAAIPFTLLEAACHAGSTIMIEARKKS
jgi:SAM-dependent methyltransferase